MGRLLWGSLKGMKWTIDMRSCLLGIGQRMFEMSCLRRVADLLGIKGHIF
jgi:hypothetical protein